ncbi:MAG: GNAT family N-acetyltransferase [Algoriphagus sp.]
MNGFKMIYVRLACEKDSKALFTWRNNEVTRSMSLTTDLVQWDGHQKWFEYTIKNPNRMLIMCLLEDTNERLAVVRFDLNEVRALVSINLSPKIRGKGMAKKCLFESIDFLKKNKAKVNFLDAEIKRENLASINSFEGVGFVRISEESDLLQFEYAI